MSSDGRQTAPHDIMCRSLLEFRHALRREASARLNLANQAQDVRRDWVRGRLLDCPFCMAARIVDPAGKEVSQRKIGMQTRVAWR